MKIGVKCSQYLMTNKSLFDKLKTIPKNFRTFSTYVAPIFSRNMVYDIDSQHHFKKIKTTAFFDVAQSLQKPAPTEEYSEHLKECHIKHISKAIEESK
jgi:3-deoxy-D-manno-octulosonic acid (KDO) 8-phosphate synthase